MKTIYGIMDTAFGAFSVVRGFAKASVIAAYSKPSASYQRKINDERIERIADYIVAGKVVYTPEVTLSYSTRDWSSPAISANELREDKDDVRFWRFSDNRNPGRRIVQISLPDKDIKPFSRIDGNHRLEAFESAKLANLDYSIPFAIILLADDAGSTDTSRTEMEIFHNINAKAQPLTPIEQYRGFLNIYTAEELYPIGREYSHTKEYIDNYKETTIRIGNVFSGIDAMDDTLVSVTKYLLDRNVEYKTQDVFEALTRLDAAYLPKHPLLRVFANRFALVPFVYYSIVNKAVLDRFVTWFLRNKLYDAKNFDPATVIEQFEKSPKSVFMSMQFCEDTKDNYNTVQNVCDKLKAEGYIDFELIKVDDHMDGFSDEIYTRIVKGIEQADLVIADLSYGNKNVHHEIGYAQGLGKRILLIYKERDGISANDDIGSNLSMHDQLRFKSQTDLQNRLFEKVRQIFAVNAEARPDI
jgi:nucleoside 2-deoxyribosyltransferase